MKIDLRFYEALRAINVSEDAAFKTAEALRDDLNEHFAAKQEMEAKFQELLSEVRLARTETGADLALLRQELKTTSATIANKTYAVAIAVGAIVISVYKFFPN